VPPILVASRRCGGVHVRIVKGRRYLSLEHLRGAFRLLLLNETVTTTTQNRRL